MAERQPRAEHPTTAEDSESALVDRARTGDAAAQEALARRYRQPAFLLALQMLSNRDDAMDVTQDALLRFFTTLVSFDSERRVKP